MFYQRYKQLEDAPMGSPLPLVIPTKSLYETSRRTKENSDFDTLIISSCCGHMVFIRTGIYGKNDQIHRPLFNVVATFGKPG